MYDLDNRLRVIRAKLESSFYAIGVPTSDADASRPLPTRDSELAYRVERTLNMQPSESIRVDTAPLIKEINRTLFKLRYRELFKAISLAFAKLAGCGERFRNWAYGKSERWGQF